MINQIKDSNVDTVSLIKRKINFYLNDKQNTCIYIHIKLQILLQKKIKVKQTEDHTLYELS